MNKLIKQFERQSGIEVYGLGLDKVKWESRLEEFAQMIVRECAQVAEEVDGDTRARTCVLEHFGVKNEPTN